AGLVAAELAAFVDVQPNRVPAALAVIEGLIAALRRVADLEPILILGHLDGPRVAVELRGVLLTQVLPGAAQIPVTAGPRVGRGRGGCDAGRRRGDGDTRQRPLWRWGGRARSELPKLRAGIGGRRVLLSVGCPTSYQGPGEHGPREAKRPELATEGRAVPV